MIEGARMRYLYIVVGFFCFWFFVLSALSHLA